MSQQKRRSAQFKFKVALEAAKEIETLNQLSGKYEVHPSQISEWKHQLLDEGPSVFSNPTSRQQQAQVALQSELYEQIGRLQMELEWLKKKVAG
jgi:putative transposase